MPLAYLKRCPHTHRKLKKGLKPHETAPDALKMLPCTLSLSHSRLIIVNSLARECREKPRIGTRASNSVT